MARFSGLTLSSPFLCDYDYRDQRRDYFGSLAGPAIPPRR
jgi:hypothetical protein